MIPLNKMFPVCQIIGKTIQDIDDIDFGGKDGIELKFSDGSKYGFCAYMHDGEAILCDVVGDGFDLEPNVKVMAAPLAGATVETEVEP